MSIKKMLNKYEDLNTELELLHKQIARVEDKDIFISKVMKITKASDELYSKILDMQDDNNVGYIDTAQKIAAEISDKLSKIHKIM